jgi:hypothetical protein
MDEQTPRVKVMRRDTALAEPEPVFAGEEEVTFSATLSTGRKVTLREMSAADLLFMEKSLANAGDMERSLKLCARLSVDDGKVSFEDLQKLKMKDLKKVTDLLGKAGGGDESEDDTDPNF